MEWIYTQTKVSDQGSLELALKKKERKIDEMRFFMIKIAGTGTGIPDCFHGPVGLDRWVFGRRLRIYRTLAKEGPLQNVGPPPTFGSISR
jgi:hypothetical protein